MLSVHFFINTTIGNIVGGLVIAVVLTMIVVSIWSCRSTPRKSSKKIQKRTNRCKGISWKAEVEQITTHAAALEKQEQEERHNLVKSASIGHSRHNLVKSVSTILDSTVVQLTNAKLKEVDEERDIEKIHRRLSSEKKPSIYSRRSWESGHFEFDYSTNLPMKRIPSEMELDELPSRSSSIRNILANSSSMKDLSNGKSKDNTLPSSLQRIISSVRGTSNQVSSSSSIKSGRRPSFLNIPGLSTADPSDESVSSGFIITSTTSSFSSLVRIKSFFMGGSQSAKVTPKSSSKNITGNKKQLHCYVNSDDGEDGEEDDVVINRSSKARSILFTIANVPLSPSLSSRKEVSTSNEHSWQYEDNNLAYNSAEIDDITTTDYFGMKPSGNSWKPLSSAAGRTADYTESTLRIEDIV